MLFRSKPYQIWPCCLTTLKNQEVMVMGIAMDMATATGIAMVTTAAMDMVRGTILMKETVDCLKSFLEGFLANIFKKK